MTRKQKPETPAHVGVRWSGGSKLATSALRLGLIIAILLGPAGVAVGWFALSRPVAVAAAPAPVVSAEDPGVGAFTVGYVGTWLSSSVDEFEDLARYIDVASIKSSLSPSPWEYRDLVAVGAVETSEGVFSVTVSANILESQFDSDGKAIQTWPRRYFQVTIISRGDVFTVATLPAPVAAPAPGSNAQLAYKEQVSASSPVGTTTTEFLRAYLCGTSGLDRFTSPESGIQAVSPALFVQVDTTLIQVDRMPSEAPSDGESVSVLATIRAFNIDSLSLPATYSLTLTARAGRWEVSHVEPSPRLHTNPDDPSSPAAPAEQDSTP